MDKSWSPSHQWSVTTELLVVAVLLVLVFVYYHVKMCKTKIQKKRARERAEVTDTVHTLHTIPNSSLVLLVSCSCRFFFGLYLITCILY